MEALLGSQRIEDYALIGDTNTAALVSRDGSIDWFCAPRFDSPACLASLLGDEGNGHWSIRPAGEATRVSRRYRGETLVLETEFVTRSGTARLVDFMPPEAKYPRIVRIVEGVSGHVPMKMELTARFEYGSRIPWVHMAGTGIEFAAGPDALRLDFSVQVIPRGLTHGADFEVSKGLKLPFALFWHPSHE